MFLGPTLIAFGWVVTNEMSTRNSRKQHSINLIMQYFTNPKRIDDKEELNTKLPYPAELVDNEERKFTDRDNKFLRAVVRELNYLDFISSAVLSRDIDERLFKGQSADTVFGLQHRQRQSSVESRALPPALVAGGCFSIGPMRRFAKFGRW